MALSDNGDHPMTKLSDTQAVILSAAAQRDDGAVLPLPETLKIKGGAVNKVIGQPQQPRPDRVLGGDGGPERVVITRRAWRPSASSRTTRRRRPPTQPASAEPQCGRRPGACHGGGRCGHAGQEQGQGEGGPGKAAKPSKAAPAPTPTPRAGTKQALMIELLRRPEGATVEQIAEVTGWQHHTIRGAISGALKKKLGLTVEATRTREVGPDKTGAKGSSTVYRITG